MEKSYTFLTKIHTFHIKNLSHCLTVFSEVALLNVQTGVLGFRRLTPFAGKCIYNQNKEWSTSNPKNIIHFI